jgi:hypothetical protein
MPAGPGRPGAPLWPSLPGLPMGSRRSATNKGVNKQTCSNTLNAIETARSDGPSSSRGTCALSEYGNHDSESTSATVQLAATCRARLAREPAGAIEAAGSCVTLVSFRTARSWRSRGALGPIVACIHQFIMFYMGHRKCTHTRSTAESSWTNQTSVSTFSGRAHRTNQAARAWFALQAVCSRATNHTTWSRISNVTIGAWRTGKSCSAAQHHVMVTKNKNTTSKRDADEG